MLKVFAEAGGAGGGKGPSKATKALQAGFAKRTQALKRGAQKRATQAGKSGR